MRCKWLVGQYSCQMSERIPVRVVSLTVYFCKKDDTMLMQRGPKTEIGLNEPATELPAANTSKFRPFRTAKPNARALHGRGHIRLFPQTWRGVTAQGKEEGSPFREVATIITRIDSADQSRTVNNAVHEACLYPVFPERAGQGGGSKKTKRCKQLQTPFGTRVKHEFAKPFGNFVEGLIGAVL